MIEQREQFPRDEHWFMLRSPRQLARFEQQPWAPLRARAFLAERLPAGVDPGAVRALCLEDVFADETDAVDIPPALGLLPALEFLRLPRKYVPRLRQADIPASVRVLEVIGDGAASFPAGITLPHVLQLAGTPAMLRFSRETFPALRHLVLRFDRERRMLPVLAGLDQLRTLGVGPNRDGAVFEAVDAGRLTALALGSGALRTLDGVERLQELESVRLTSMDSLESIAALARLPKLRELSISWCARLANFDVLLEIPTLERLTIFGCKAFDPRRYGPLLEALPLQELSYPGRVNIRA